jgi:hypothetical protein
MFQSVTPTPTGDSGAAATQQIDRQATPTERIRRLSGAPSHSGQEGATENQIRMARSATVDDRSAGAALPSTVTGLALGEPGAALVGTRPVLFLA